jgi:high affinity Mn2+ porin
MLSLNERSKPIPLKKGYPIRFNLKFSAPVFKYQAAGDDLSFWGSYRKYSTVHRVWLMVTSCLLLVLWMPCKGISQNDTLKGLTYHFQLTTVLQGYPTFHAAYSGLNSLKDSAESALSLTSTIFFGATLWKGAEGYLNPEIAGGTGLSSTLGIAGFPNGETFRIGDPSPQLYFARAYIKQHLALGGQGSDTLLDGADQVREIIPAHRLDITLGKLALSDIFDDNVVSHDPRTDFLNWALMNNGAWDYAANTRGYTYMLAVELIQPSWALRFAEALEPSFANGPYINFNILKTQTENLELDKKIRFGSMPGNIRMLVFLNSNKGPSYLTVLQNKENGTDTSLDVVYGTTYGHLKYGAGFNMDQQVGRFVSAFLRAGWNNGQTATWAFANIDQTASAGIRITGDRWKRKQDHVGIAAVMDGISADHRQFLASGGYDFMIGDGKLTHYGPESILELFYEANFLHSLFITADYQMVTHPAYNMDRGPVHIFSIRTHVEF